MNKKEYVMPSIKIKGICPSYLMAGSLNQDKPTEGLDEDLEPGGDDPADFSKENAFGSVWED